MYGVRCATLHRFDATARRIAASSDATTFLGFALRVLLHNFGLCPTDVCIFYCVFGKFPHNCRICRYEIGDVGDDPACAVTNRVRPAAMFASAFASLLFVLAWLRVRVLCAVTID